MKYILCRREKTGFFEEESICCIMCLDMCAADKFVHPFQIYREKL